MEEGLFRQAVDLVLASGQSEIRILGGEPTLHPRLSALIDYALGTGAKVLLFTNGLVDEGFLNYASQLRTDRIDFLLNLSPRESYSDEQWTRLAGFLRGCGERIMPGTTVSLVGQNLDYLLDHIAEFGLQKKVRLGLAHPSPDQSNSFLAPRDYLKAGKDIAAFIMTAGEAEVQVLLDCGFVPCMFGREHPAFPQILRRLSHHPCEPVTDILPDGGVISCYPLGHLTRRFLKDYPDLKTLQQEYASGIGKYSTLGIFRECPICVFKARGQCDGGCIAQRIARFHSATGFTPAR